MPLRRVPWGAFHRVNEFDLEKDNTGLFNYSGVNNFYWYSFDQLPYWYREYCNSKEYCFVVKDLVKIYSVAGGDRCKIEQLFERAIEYARKREHG